MHWLLAHNVFTWIVIGLLTWLAIVVLRLIATWLFETKLGNIVGVLLVLMWVSNAFSVVTYHVHNVAHHFA